MTDWLLKSVQAAMTFELDRGFEGALSLERVVELGNGNLPVDRAYEGNVIELGGFTGESEAPAEADIFDQDVSYIYAHSTLEGDYIL